MSRWVKRSNMILRRQICNARDTHSLSHDRCVRLACVETPHKKCTTEKKRVFHWVAEDEVEITERLCCCTHPYWNTKCTTETEKAESETANKRYASALEDGWTLQEEKLQNHEEEPKQRNRAERWCFPKTETEYRH
jgi:hypothetical protein